MSKIAAQKLVSPFLVLKVFINFFIVSVRYLAFVYGFCQFFYPILVNKLLLLID